MRTLAVSIILGFCCSSLSHADESSVGQQIRAAIGKAIPLLEKGAAGSAKQRKCFTCHNQALPVFALVEAQAAGFDVDEENLAKQVQHTVEHLRRGKANYEKGKGQGGRVLTAGYALWALEVAEHDDDDVTSAVTSYLVKYQDGQTYWHHPGNRPPSSGSKFATTYVALRGLARYASDNLADTKQKRFDRVRAWLETAKANDTEDHVFRLRSMFVVGSKPQQIKRAAQHLLELQNEDGGWSQTKTMTSDAYATGTALTALLKEGGIKNNHPAIQKGKDYLLRTQLDDGSWHVATRAKGFQKYFESGFPHKKDQFISIAASSWATIALLQLAE